MVVINANTNSSALLDRMLDKYYPQRFYVCESETWNSYSSGIALEFL